MRKPVFCICEIKDADQLQQIHIADQRLCFRYTDSTIHLLYLLNPKFQAPGEASHLLWLSDLVGRCEDRHSLDTADIVSG